MDHTITLSSDDSQELQSPVTPEMCSSIDSGILSGSVDAMYTDPANQESQTKGPVNAFDMNAWIQTINKLTQKIGDLSQNSKETTQKIDETTQKIDDLSQKIKNQSQELSQKIEDQSQKIEDQLQRTQETVEDIKDQLKDHIQISESRFKNIEKLLCEQTDRVDEAVKETEYKIEKFREEIHDDNAKLKEDILECQDKLKDLSIRVENQTINLEIEDVKTQIHNQVQEIICQQLEEKKDQDSKNLLNHLEHYSKETQDLGQYVQRMESTMENHVKMINSEILELKSQPNIDNKNMLDEVHTKLGQIDEKYQHVHRDIEEVKDAIDKPAIVDRTCEQILVKMDGEWKNYKIRLDKLLTNQDQTTAKQIWNFDTSGNDKNKEKTRIKELYGEVNPPPLLPVNDTNQGQVGIDPQNVNIVCRHDNPCIETRNSMAIRFIKIRIFRGEYLEDPSEYLQNLEELFKLSQISEEEKISIACNHLSATAKYWWQSLFEQPNSYEEFRYLILTSFWGVDHQDNIRSQVIREKYTPSKGSYTQFFRYQAAKLKNLTAFDMSEQQIIMILRQNLPKHAEQLLIASDKPTIKGNLEILGTIESSDRSSENKFKVLKEFCPSVSQMSIPHVPPWRRRPLNDERGRSRTTPYSISSSPVKRIKMSNQNNANVSQPSTSGIFKILKKPSTSEIKSDDTGIYNARSSWGYPKSN